ncbi:MAG TPA: 5-(carboxyamino)imidazole ribonucleotide mutase [Candidatus Nitrosocosmicus sp.]
MSIVSIIMGSDSDLYIMRDAAEILNDFEVPHEIKIVSAHRTPTYMFDFAQNAEQRGIKVIIAGAGGAAHLPGMVASLTSLPVIGVPIKSSTSIIGIDSLLSIAQMPPGVPVATMAINGAKNAGIFACSILAIHSNNLSLKIKKFKKQMEQISISKDKTLNTLGFKSYQKEKDDQENIIHPN